MKFAQKALCLAALLMGAPGCIEDGSTADCGAGGRANLEADGCVTPIGGSCLNEDQFSKGRPKTTTEERAQLEKDWAKYQKERPLCFP